MHDTERLAREAVHRMTLGSAGVLVVVAGLTGALAACSERPGDRDAAHDDSLRVDSVRADSFRHADSARAADSATRRVAESVPTSSRTPDRPTGAPDPAVPPESAVRRPPIMDPAAKDRPPARLPRPDSPGTAP